jgi:quinolinate synthase
MSFRHRLLPPTTFSGSREDLVAEVTTLKRERNAVILSHNYQVPEVQDIADYVGDSLGLSQVAARTEADVIVFCGVHFMAETASIISPQKKVLLPDLGAGCSLAATIDADKLRAWKKEHPNAVVVSYVNTTAEVKAESDYCCTSANAAKVVRAIPAELTILFLPDKFLAEVVARQTGRSNIVAYPGYCHVHKTIRPEQVVEIMDQHPDIELLLHPECGCVSSCMSKALDGTLPQDRTFFLSTEGMLRHIGESSGSEFAVGTELGIMHQLNKKYPEKTFHPVNPNAVCAFMKTITLDRVIRSLETLAPQITVPSEIAQKAKRAIDRMLELA